MRIKVILGLGNPGTEYQKTYHNLGVLFVDHLMRTFGAEPAKDSRTYQTFKSRIKGGDILIIKPKIYMNESAEALIPLMKNANWKLGEILIAHDDSDIAFGKYKYSFGRSSAGHRGVQSIIDALGTNKFHRVRIGIRKKPGKALDFVLKRIPAGDLKVFEDLFSDITKFLETNLE